jgi:hypothetical protein
MTADLGEHNADVLTSRLCLSEDRVAELTEAGVLFRHP